MGDPDGTDQPVRLVCLARGDGRNSMDKVARSYHRALDAVGVKSEISPREMLHRARFGGQVLPWARFAIDWHKGGGLHHATEPTIAFRGTDVVTIHVCYFGRRVPKGAENNFWDRMTVVQTLTSVRRAKRVACVSPFVVEEIRRDFGKRLGEKARYIPLAFEAQPGRMEPERDIGWVGVGYPRKNLWLLALALEDGPHRSVGLRYRALPAHPIEDLINRSCWDDAERYGQSVEWIGPMDEQDLNVFYRTSRCVVATSSYEGFHAVPFEAWIRGTPIVIPNVETYRAQFPEGTKGVHFYKINDGAALRESIEAAIADPPFVPDRSLVKEHTFENSGAELKALYEECGRR